MEASQEYQRNDASASGDEADYSEEHDQDTQGDNPRKKCN